MGLYASADLVWGILVDAEEPYWDEVAEDWREFDGDLELVPFGHYEGYDENQAVLTSARMPKYWASTSMGKAVEVPFDLPSPQFHDKAYSKANDQARAAGLDVDFYGEASWWLTASFG